MPSSMPRHTRHSAKRSARERWPQPEDEEDAIFRCALQSNDGFHYDCVDFEHCRAILLGQACSLAAHNFTMLLLLSDLGQAPCDGKVLASSLPRLRKLEIGLFEPKAHVEQGMAKPGGDETDVSWEPLQLSLPCYSSICIQQESLSWLPTEIPMECCN